MERRVGGRGGGGGYAWSLVLALLNDRYHHIPHTDKIISPIANAMDTAGRLKL